MKMKFFHRTLSYFMVPIMIPVLILGTLSGITLNRYMREGIDQRYQDRLNSHMTRIEVMLNELNWLNMSLSNNPGIQFRLKNIINRCNDGIPANAYEEINTIIDLLNGSNNANTAMESIYIYFNNPSQQFISSSNRITNLNYFFDKSWYDSYLQHMDMPETTWSEFRSIEPYAFDGSTRAILTIYHKIYSPGRIKPAGVIVLNIRSDMINRLLNEYVSEPELLFFITDEEYQRIFYNKQSQAMEDAEILLWTAPGNRAVDKVGAGKDTVENAMEDKAAADKRVRYKGIDYLVYYQQSSDLGWHYYLGVPLSLAYLVPDQLTRIAAGLILLALVLSTGASYFFARKNYKSLMGIVDIFDKASHGQELPALSRKTTSIYDYILYNIVETFLQNDFLQVQLSERRYKLKAMELIALQAQINPHFLMNTLQTVYWRCISMTQGPNPASEMLENLSDILHFSLESSQELVSLKEELDIAKSYLRIQIQRYKNQFEVKWEIETDVNSVMVPKLILQPLIENSIYHGIRDKEGFSTIKIKISLRDGWVILVVLDNGLGMTKEQLSALRKRISEQDTQDGMHIGLLNTHKRLELLYGENYKIRIFSKAGRGTIVELRMKQ